MKPYPIEQAEEHRILTPLMGHPDEDPRCGAFHFRRKNASLCVIASTGLGWDHVSVSLATRCPTWDEMCYMEEIFFLDSEVVMQLHPAESHYVNMQPHCLHLWRPLECKIPTPPMAMV